MERVGGASPATSGKTSGLSSHRPDAEPHRQSASSHHVVLAGAVAVQRTEGGVSKNVTENAISTVCLFKMLSRTF